MIRPTIDTPSLTIACYENIIPPFVPGKLEQLYGSMYSSFVHFDVYGGLDQVSTYVTESDAGIQDIFLYRRVQHCIHVVNEQMQLKDASINDFARTMFDRYADVDCVRFHAVDVAKSRLNFPHQRHTCTNDITMPLPATVDEYYAGLGKSSRKTLNQNGNRLQKRYETFRFFVQESDQVDESQLKEIISLNHARMAGKSRVSALGEKEAASIIAFTKRCGIVGIVTIHGKICAGAICYRIGDHFHLRVIGHDPDYNTYGLGMLCCYRTICECIERGGTEFHFMWGQEEYKYRLKGVQRELAHIVIYRSLRKMATNAGAVLQTLVQGWRIQSHMWLLERLRRKDHWSTRLMHQSMGSLRKVKRLASNPISGKQAAALSLDDKDKAQPSPEAIDTYR